MSEPATPRRKLPLHKRGKLGFALAASLPVVLVVGASVAWVCYRGGFDGPIGPGDMDRAPEGRWFAVSRDGLVGSREQLDVIANFPWALALARGWRSDVVVERVEVDRVDRHGVGPDVTSKRRPQNARYRFASPSRMRDADAAAEVSDEPMATGITIWLSENSVRAMLDNTRADPRTSEPPVFGCAMSEVVSIARAQPRIRAQASHRVWLRRYGEPERWVWSVDAGRSIHVDARTCALVR